MDVHAPHGGIHSWRDFLVHMATICIGLLMAIALEQSVEAFHHSQQRRELQKAMDRDSQDAAAEALGCVKSADATIAWSLKRMAQIRAALAAPATPLAPLPRNAAGFGLPEDPAFKAAKSSDLLPLLSQEDILAYSEADTINDEVDKEYEAYASSRIEVRKFELQFAGPGGIADFSKASAAELHRYLDLVSDQAWKAFFFRYWSEEVHGIETALLHGERNLGVLSKAARRHTPVAGLELR